MITVKIKSIGVRELVEFSLKSGDLKSSGAGRQNTALDGSRIHRMIQASWDDDVSVETDLQMQITAGKTPLLIHGRADGLHQTGGIVDEVLEIKTSSFDFLELPNNVLTLYFAQAKIYSHILMKGSNLAQMKVTLLYFQTTTEQLSKKTVVVTRKEASEIFNQAVSEYQKWLELENVLHEQRQESLKMLKFPFDKYRKNQRELAVCVYKTIASKKRLFVEAPTGTGKTVSVLFPALKAMGEEKCSRIFYLTAKQSTRKSCEDAIALMQPNLRSITLTAKDKITFDEEKDLPDDQNPYFIGYYDRIRPAMHDVLKHETMITRDVIERYARLHQVDPFEFSLDLSLFCDVIICDYNYLFDPLVCLQRFFTDEHPDCCFLIDEAHNLVSRAKEMYSSSLLEESFLLAESDVKKLARTNNIARKIKDVSAVFETLKKPMQEFNQASLIMKEQLDSLFDPLEKFIDFTQEWMRDNPDQSQYPNLLNCFFEAYSFVKISGFYNETFRTKLVYDNNNRLLDLKIFSLNPSSLLDQSLNLGGSSVLFSATLSPLEYYQEMLGGFDSLIYALPPPFDSNHLKVLIDDKTQVTYRKREENLPTIVSKLKITVEAHCGNYLVFCPSYAYLEKLHEAFRTAFPNVKTIIQENSMSEEQRRAFLESFAEKPKEPLIGFAVLGGIFSEGIDLKGTRLSGCAIISVGLPMLNDETDELRKYFDEKNFDGFQYAYQLPGLNNVFQAAGRVIRGERDVGVVLLIDERFAERRYVQFYPQFWNNLEYVHGNEQLRNSLDNFWNIQG